MHPTVKLTCFRLEFCISRISLSETPDQSTNHCTLLWSWPALGWSSASPGSRSLRLQKKPQITAPLLWSWPALGWSSASPGSRSLRLQKKPQITAPLLWSWPALGCSSASLRSRFLRRVELFAPSSYSDIWWPPPLFYKKKRILLTIYSIIKIFFL